MTDLDDWMAGEEPDLDAEPAPVDREQADRFLRHLARLDAADREDTELAQAEAARITEWLDDRRAVRENRRKFYRACLEQTMRAAVEADPTCRTIKLPAGELRARPQRPEWSWPVNVEAWIDDADLADLVRMRFEPAKADAQKILRPAPGEPGETVPVTTPDGTVVEGVTVTYRPDKFTAVPHA